MADNASTLNTTFSKSSSVNDSTFLMPSSQNDTTSSSTKTSAADTTFMISNDSSSILQDEKLNRTKRSGGVKRSSQGMEDNKDENRYPNRRSKSRRLDSGSSDKNLFPEPDTEDEPTRKFGRKAGKGIKNIKYFSDLNVA